ncbi:MAG TPA: TolC family protein [Sedimentisphaerales bacterium]|nr:TolC family protein [Sedimentisphaerales bacterium]
MSKRLPFARYLYVLVLEAALLLLAGCQRIIPDEKFYEIKTPPDKLRQIDTLDLEQVASGQKPTTDANQAPPKQLDLTLEHCRAMALANNLDLKVQLISPAIAARQVSEEEARFEAAFFSTLSYSKTDRPVAAVLDVAGSRIDSSDIDLGVEVPLRTGGTLRFDVADNRTKTNFLGSTFNPSYTSLASVSISHELLRGAGKRANMHPIRIAQYQQQIVEAATKLEVIRVLADVDRVYWRLYAARRELEVRKQQYDLAKTQLDQTRRFVDSGERSQVETIRAEAGVAERLEAIILAENNLRDRERELKRILNEQGLEMQTPTILLPATVPDPVHYDLAGRPLVAAAVDNRMEMLELELQIAQDISTIDFQRNQALPLVTLGYTYNINGLGPTRSDSFDLLYDKNFEDHRLGLQLLVPLGNEAAKSRLLQAFYQRRQRLATRRNRMMLIELEVLNAVDQLEANWQRILAGRQNSILAARLFEAEKKQFELGLRTSTDVLDAQTKFAEAQSAEILALTEYQIAQVDLAFATGTLLGAAKVRWEPIVPQVDADPPAAHP